MKKKALGEEKEAKTCKKLAGKKFARPDIRHGAAIFPPTSPEKRL